MKRILIPTDFSENSTKVCEYAINIIGNNKSEILLFHILPDSIMIPDSSFPAGIDSDAFLNSEYLEILQKQAENNMQKLKESTYNIIKGKNLKNIELNTSITSGDAEWEIINACDDFKPEVIVMGTRGEGNKGFLEGSMAEKIMSKIQIPVIAVPEDCNYNKPKNLLYTTNYSDKDFSKIHLLFKLLKSNDIKIFVAHFDLDKKQDSENEKINNLKLAFKDEILKGNINFNIIKGTDKSASLNSFCETFNIDMITFISHKTNIFKTLFSHKIHKKDFFKLNLPMLAMHE